MKLLEVLKSRNYAYIALISSLGMALIYPYLQVALNGGIYNYLFWFENILSTSILNFILYLIFSLLFGVSVSFSIYSWKNRACNIKAISSGSFGGTLAVLTSQCSACISLASFILPATAVTALALYNTMFNFVSISAILLAIHLMGGFRKS